MESRVWSKIHACNSLFTTCKNFCLKFLCNVPKGPERGQPICSCEHFVIWPKNKVFYSCKPWGISLLFLMFVAIKLSKKEKNIWVSGILEMSTYVVRKAESLSWRHTESLTGWSLELKSCAAWRITSTGEERFCSNDTVTSITSISASCRCKASGGWELRVPSSEP